MYSYGRHIIYSQLLKWIWQLRSSYSSWNGCEGYTLWRQPGRVRTWWADPYCALTARADLSITTDEHLRPGTSRSSWDLSFWNNMYIIYIYILCDTACVYPHLSLWAFSCSLLRLVRADTEEDRQALSRPWVSAMGLAVSPATRPWSKRGRCQRQLPAKKNHMSSRWSEAHRAQQCGNDVARIIKGRSWECHVVLYCTEPCCVAIHFAPWNAKECAPQRPQHAAAASHFAESCDTMQIDAGLGSWEKPLKLRGCTRLAAQKFRPKLPSEWSERSVFASGLDAWNSIRCLRLRNHHGGWCQGMGCGQRPSDCTTRLSQQTGEAKLSMAVANSAGGRAPCHAMFGMVGRYRMI